MRSVHTHTHTHTYTHQHLRTTPIFRSRVDFDVRLTPVKIVEPLTKTQMELEVNTYVAVLTSEYAMIWCFLGFSSNFNVCASE